MPLAELREKFLSLDTASICDADKSIRVLDTSIRPLIRGLTLLGTARTAKAHGDFLTVIRALREAREGEVLVIDAGGNNRAVAGELFATEAKLRGLAGLIIDGACRDTRRLSTLGLPVYARHVSPLAGLTQATYETQIPVQCGGVSVQPGEIVFGDDDGVVILSEEEALRLLPRAIEIQQIEGRVLEQMERGRSLFDMLNYEEHWAAIEQRKTSSLRFML